MGRGRCFLAALLATACGADPPPYVPYQSGTRLRARTYVAEGAPPVFHSFYDKERQEPCDVRLASDGTWRCLPASRVAHQNLGYADADCTRPVGVLTAPGCVASPGSYYSFGRGPCADRKRIHRQQGILPAGSPLFRLEGTRCEPSFGSTEESAILEVIPDAEFAVMAPATYHAPPLAQRLFHGADGSRQYREYLDVATGATLVPRWWGDAALRPLTAGLDDDAVFAEYGDLACSQRLFCLYQVSCPDPEGPPAFVNRYRTADGCLEETLHQRGALRVPLASRNGGECLPRDSGRPTDGLSFTPAACYELGATVPATRFPTTRRVEEGSGRLRVVRYQVMDGIHPVPVRRPDDEVFYDTQLERACRARLAADGVTRCLPIEAQVNLFADSSCTVAVGVEVEDFYPMCGSDPLYSGEQRFAYQMLDCDPTDGPVRLFDLGELITGTPVGFERRFGGCERLGAGAEGRAFFRVTEHPAEDFFPLTEQIE